MCAALVSRIEIILLRAGVRGCKVYQAKTPGRHFVLGYGYEVMSLNS